MHRLGSTSIVITGVGRRGQAGEAVARAFAEKGASLILLGRDEALLGERAEELRALTRDVRTIACDLTDAPAVARAGGSALRYADGRIDAVIALAGGFAMNGPVASSEADLFHGQIATNLTTAYLTTGAFLPGLRAARGSLVYFASEAVLPGSRIAGMSGYAAAKSGVVALMRAVAQEEAANGVRANAVAPTSIRTRENEAEMGTDRRYVERSTVAEAVLWLCSPAASGVTGQVVHLGPETTASVSRPTL